MAAGQDNGGVGGSREGVGKTVGLGEGEKDSDIVEGEVGGERKKRAVARVVNVAEEDDLSCALPGPPEPLRCAVCLSPLSRSRTTPPSPRSLS